LSRHFHS